MEYAALSVEGGVEQPPTMNPKRGSARSVRRQTPTELVELLTKGDPVALGKAITLIESSSYRDRPAAKEVIEKCLPLSGNSIRVGITGVPGVGKSTFIEAFGFYIADQLNKKLAVLAIDPTSLISGGSILGDKSRMPKLSAHANAFVRPSPTGGSLGGVAAKTREAMILCEAAGYELMLIETVGVGQSELAVHSMVDCFLLLMLSGAGDEMQGIKRGIMEMADILAITKVDGENINASKVAAQRYRNALHLFPPTASKWSPSVLLTSSMSAFGIDEVWSEIIKFVEHEKAGHFFEKRRGNQSKQWLKQTIETRILEDFYRRPNLLHRLAFLEERVAKGEITVRSASDALFEETNS